MTYHCRLLISTYKFDMVELVNCNEVWWNSINCSPKLCPASLYPILQRETSIFSSCNSIPVYNWTIRTSFLSCLAKFVYMLLTNLPLYHYLIDSSVSKSNCWIFTCFNVTGLDKYCYIRAGTFEPLSLSGLAIVIYLKPHPCLPSQDLEIHRLLSIIFKT